MLEDRGVSGGHLGAWFVRFGENNEAENAPGILPLRQLHEEDDEQWPGFFFCAKTW